MRIKTKTVAVHWVAWNQLIYSFERKVLCQTAPRINQNHLSISVVLLTPAEVKSKLTEIYVQHDTWANMSFSWLYHDPLLHVFPAIMTCMRLFFNFVLVDIIFCVLFLFFIPILFYLFIPPSLVGCTSCVSVLSLPVQCWSLSYGKQRRPFRLCAPTWLRQQVWRSFYLFWSWSLFITAFSLSWFPLWIPVDD